MCRKGIAKYFNRESTIIYPAVKQYKYIKQGNYWLSVNRLYPHKRVELQIEAFRQMPEEKLYIVGGFMQGDNARDYAKKILKDLPENVRYLGVVSEEKLAKLLWAMQSIHHHIHAGRFWDVIAGSHVCRKTNHSQQMKEDIKRQLQMAGQAIL